MNSGSNTHHVCLKTTKFSILPPTTERAKVQASLCSSEVHGSDANCFEVNMNDGHFLKSVHACVQLQTFRLIVHIATQINKHCQYWPNATVGLPNCSIVPRNWPGKTKPVTGHLYTSSWCSLATFQNFINLGHNARHHLGLNWT